MSENFKKNAEAFKIWRKAHAQYRKECMSGRRLTEKTAYEYREAGKILDRAAAGIYKGI